MALLKKSCEKIILIIIAISILIMFIVTPASYAKLDLKEGEFYYAGTTKGSYTVKDGIFAWLLDNIGQIADWLVGLMTMGFRMVFVGWTALIEKLLTWGLESTVGVNVVGGEVDGMSNTDLSSITDSTNNLTVQAIVYNRVPAFNINFFDLSDEYDKTVSGTGKILVCEKCTYTDGDKKDQNKKVVDCCGEDASHCCDACGGNCDACKTYKEAILNANDPDGVVPIVLQLKKIVANWYYILRILSMAVMLVVLIGIGIKMAISTIASEKAVYKRMLVDWVVGAIILFAIHYLMIFVININDSLVKVIEKAANNVNTVQMKQLAGNPEKNKEELGVIKNNEEIEIDIYEAVRTRAYDPKLINGISGMLMYMTLVYFAIRYTIVYIKRYLTLVVLTLMGPPVGVAYALQKVFSGKSSTLKTWMMEYVTNVIIQSVHAIIYGVFISTALILSLQSISGIIVALILMNYSLKAEASFRKIFKFGEGDSLLAHTAEAGNAEKMKQNLDTAVGLYAGAKPLAGALMNSPYGKAVKGVGKVAAAGGIVGAAVAVKAGKGIKNIFTNQNNETEVESSSSGQLTNGTTQSNGNAQPSGGSSSAQPADSTSKGTSPIVQSTATVADLMSAGKEKLQQNVAIALNQVNQTKEGTPERAAAELQYKKALADYKALVSPSTKDIILGHAEQLVDIDNHFSFTKNTKGRPTFTFDNLAKLHNGIFGTKHKDFKTGKMVSDGNGLYSQLGASNLLGFTDADKKIFKENVLNPIKNGLGGMAMMFVGAGTLIAHPTMGMGLLAAGTTLKNKALKKQAINKRYKGRYGFSRFSTPSMLNVQKAALARARREMNQGIANQLKDTHPDFYNELKSGMKTNGASRDLKNAAKAALGTSGVGIVAGAGLGIPQMGAVALAGLASRKYIEKTAMSDNLNAINRHAFKQMHDQQQEFMKDALNYQSAVEMANAERLKEEHDKEYERKLFKELGYSKNENTGEITEVEYTEFQKQVDEIEEKIREEYKKDNKSNINLASGIQSGEITINSNRKSKKITDKEIKDINKLLDKMMLENPDLITEINMDNVDISSLGKNNKDLNKDEKAYKTMIEKLNMDLTKAGIISKGESINIANDIKDGKSNMIEAMKRKNEFSNKKKEVIIDATLNSLDKDNKHYVVQALEKVSKKKSNVKAKDVIDQAMKDYIAKEEAEKSKTNRLSKEEKKKIEEDAKAFKEKLQQANKNGNSIEAYIELNEVSEMIGPDKIDRKERLEAVVESKKKKRADKLNQILNLDIQGADTSDDIINTLEKGKVLRDKDGDIISLTPNDATEIVEMLLIRKELESINEFAKKELDIEKGSNSYKQAIKNKSNKAVEYYQEEIINKFKIEDFKQRNSGLYESGGKAKSGNDLEEALKDNEERTGVSIENKRKEFEEIQKIESKLSSKLKAMQDAERNISAKGPIADISKFINDNY